MTRTQLAAIVGASMVMATAAAPTSAAYPHCPADANADGTIDKFDIPVFVHYWMAGDTSADFNLDGALTVQDVFDFLTAVFANDCGSPVVPVPK